MVTIKNISNQTIPRPFNNDSKLIIKAISSGLYYSDNEVKTVVDDFIEIINNSLKRQSDFEKIESKTPKVKTNKNTLDFEVKKIHTDTKRFQNRNKLNKEVLAQIIENYDPQKLDAVVIWKDRNNKYYLLAGHHRLEATKQLNIKTIPARIFKGTEAEAIKYAKVESNSNRSLETPLERANIYREMHEKGLSKKEIEAKAKQYENKNASSILNLSFLNPKGAVVNAYSSLDETDTQNKNLIEKIADWIGNARRNNKNLTNAHELEMFNFLLDKNKSKRFNSKVSFLQKVNAISTAFDFDNKQALNLERLKYKSEGEKIYDKEHSELKEKLKELVEKRADLKAKCIAIELSNDKDKKAQENNCNIAISKVKDEIKFYTKKLLELQRKKGTYSNAGNNQAALFGYKNEGLGLPIVIDITEDLADQQQTNNKQTTQLPVVENEKEQNTDTVFKEDSLSVVSSNENIVPTINKPISKDRKKYKTAADLQNEQKQPVNLFRIHGDLKTFLGDLEVKPVQSLLVTLDSREGGGKTHTFYQWANHFANLDYKTIIWSLEEHKTSNLSKSKVNQYFTDKAKTSIVIESENDGETKDQTFNRVIESIDDFDVIFIDSLTKLTELNNRLNVDQDLRKKFNGKLIFIIIQRLSDGKPRGGSKSVFDGDIILKVEVDEDFRNNYIYNHKNRYNSFVPLHELKYSPYLRKIITKQDVEGQELPNEMTVNI